MPFSPVETGQPPTRVIAALWGQPKEGKTHTALTGPEPIRFQNFDYGVSELLAKFGGKHIDRADYFLPEEFDEGIYQAIYDEFRKDHLWALANTPGGTVVVDTGTQVWQMVQLLKLEPIKLKRLKKVKEGEEPRIYPFDYADANATMAGLMRRAHQYPDVNVIWTYRAKPVYGGDGKPTGKWDPQWFGETPSIVQMAVHIYQQSGETMAKVTSNRFDRDTVGMVTRNPEYADLMAWAGA